MLVARPTMTITGLTAIDGAAFSADAPVFAIFCRANESLTDMIIVCFTRTATIVDDADDDHRRRRYATLTFAVYCYAGGAREGEVCLIDFALFVLLLSCHVAIR